jgi:hypothetical protein
MNLQWNTMVAWLAGHTDSVQVLEVIMEPMVVGVSRHKEGQVG